MLKQRKENKKKCSKSQLMIVGSLLILIGISVIGFRVCSNIFADKQEEKAITEFYIEQDKIEETPITEETPQEEKEEVKQTTNTANYVAVLKIPKIGLEKGLFSKGSYSNNVNRNIEIIEDSDLPDKENGNVILAGHSGSGRTAYFKNLHKIGTNDIVSLFYNGYEYRYRVVNSYDIPKTGTAEIVRNNEKSTLTLITCRQGTEKQIVIICELFEKL